jgi:hypothetical protein
MKYILFLLIIVLISCAGPKDPNDLGLVERLPKGEYVIWNYGSRHIVKCQNSEGKFYYLNDANFDQNNGIAGYDAQQYHEKTKITIK